MRLIQGGADIEGKNWNPMTSGRRFYIANPSRSDYDITDIARGLSRCRRWAGQGDSEITSAQHCCEVERLVQHMAIARGFDEAEILEARRAALMHDATDALGFGDVSVGVELRCRDYVALKTHVLQIVFVHYRLAWPMPSIVAEADETVRAKEWRLLFGDPVPPELLALEPEKKRQLVAWDDEHAYHEWLHRWLSLSGESA